MIPLLILMGIAIALLLLVFKAGYHYGAYRMCGKYLERVREVERLLEDTGDEPTRR